MSFDQYKPPETNIDSSESSVKQPVRGVLIPMVVDIVGTVSCQLILGILYALTLSSKGFSVDEIDEIFSSVKSFSLYGGILHAIGMFFSTLAGYMCIRISRGVSYLYPVVLATITLIFSIFVLAAEMPFTEVIGWGILSFALTLFGAYLALKQISKKRSEHANNSV